MKHKSVIFILLAAICLNCSGRGEVVTPPHNMEQAVKDYYARKPENPKYSYELLSITVREYPNEVYLISADYIFNTPDSRKQGHQQLVAEKGQKDGAYYWQIYPAHKDKLRILGIKPE